MQSLFIKLYRHKPTTSPERNSVTGEVTAASSGKFWKFFKNISVLEYFWVTASLLKIMFRIVHLDFAYLRYSRGIE